MSRSSTRTRTEKSRASSVLPPQPPEKPPEDLETPELILGRLTETAWVTMVAREEGEEVVAELVAQLTATVLDRCYEVYLQKQLVPFTVSWAWGSLVQTVDWLFLLRDEGEGAESAPLWAEDPEAVPSTCLDSWGEGCVPVHYYCVSSHTPLLQKLLDLHSVESDPQSKAQPPANQERPDRERQNVSETAPPGNAEPDISETAESAVPSSRRGRQKPRPPPDNASVAPYRPSQPPPATPKRITPGGAAVRQGHAAILPLRPLRNATVPRRIDPAHLPRRHVRPEVVILEVSPSRRSRGRLRPLLQPDCNQVSTGRQEPFTPLPCYQRLPEKRRNVRRTQVHQVHQGHQRRGSSPGYTPPPAGLLLDAMALAPGVSWGGPVAGEPFSGRKEEQGLVPRQSKLRPIRSSLPAPLWSLDQLVAGEAPRVMAPRVTSPTGTP